MGKIKYLLFALFILSSSCSDFRKIELPSPEMFYSNKFDYQFVKALYLQNIGNETLHMALVIHESRMNNNAVFNNGHKGKDYGYYQINSNAFKNYKVCELKNPMRNIEIGSRHLNKCLKMSNGDIELALNYYHLGKNAVDNKGYWNYDYVRNIINIKNKLEIMYNQELKIYEYIKNNY